MRHGTTNTVSWRWLGNRQANGQSWKDTHNGLKMVEGVKMINNVTTGSKRAIDVHNKKTRTTEGKK